MKILILPILLFLLAGCSKPQNLEKTQWRPGDDIRELQYLNEIDRTMPQVISVLNEKLEYSPQVFSGIVIEDTFVKTINNKDGQLISVSSAHTQNLSHFSKVDLNAFRLTPDLQDRLLKDFPFLTTKDLKNLKPVFESNGRAVWTLFYFDLQGTPYQLKLDQDLILLSKKSVGANHFSGTAFVYPWGPKLGPLKEVPIQNLSFNPPLSNPQFIITSNTATSFSPTDSVLKYSTKDPRFDQLQVYFYIAQALDWIRDTLDISISFPLDVQLHMGFPEKTNAAFYYQGHIRLGAGDDVVYTKIPHDPSIVSHEVFHALIETIARLPYEGEGGSLNEAFADFFTSQLLGRPQLAEASYLQGPYKRSIENEKNWADKKGALYGDSLIVSGLLWELSQNLPKTKILNAALKTLSHLNPSSDFNDFNRECRDALQEYLSEAELAKAQTILHQRGFPK